MNLEKISAAATKEETLLPGLKAISDYVLQFYFSNFTLAGPEFATAMSKFSSLLKSEMFCSFSTVSFSIVGADFMTVINNTRRKIFIFENIVDFYSIVEGRLQFLWFDNLLVTRLSAALHSLKRCDNFQCDSSFLLFEPIY